MVRGCTYIGNLEKAKLRFHLGRGKNYMHWQLRLDDSNPLYYKPEDVLFKLGNVKLHNRRGVAQKIYEGGNKNPCAWLLTSNPVVISRYDSQKPVEVFGNGFRQVGYNPRVLPYWTWKDLQGKDNGENLDGRVFNEVIVNGKEIFVR